MDSLLRQLEAQGREPQHWVIRRADWLEIGAKLADEVGRNLLPDTAIVANSYRGVPVHFANLHDGAIVGIVDRQGEQILEEDA